MLTELKKARLLVYLVKKIRKDKHFLNNLNRARIRECLSEEKI